MIRIVRGFILLTATSLIVASLIHFEVIIEGYRHQEAGISEAVIAAAMLVGLAFTWLPGRRQVWAGFGSLAFGLLGTLVGVFTIIIGVGPQTVPDILYHATLIVALAAGLTFAWRGLSHREGTGGVSTEDVDTR